MAMNPETEHRTAIHEAGHAVAALLTGKPYGCALHVGGGSAGPGDNRPEPDWSLYTPEKQAGHYDGSGVQETIADAVILAAGEISERLDAGSAYIGPIASRGDRVRLAEGARKILQDEVDHATIEAWSAFVGAAARRRLGPHLESIRAVAEKLKERRSLSAADVARIYAETRKESES
jgi:ATP-dependent Zn protease